MYLLTYLLTSPWPMALEAVLIPESSANSHRRRSKSPTTTFRDEMNGVPLYCRANVGTKLRWLLYECDIVKTWKCDVWQC